MPLWGLGLWADVMVASCMLALRETHKGEGLDWLILPELAVHPNDVRTHLVPFARAHKALILTGLTYQEVLAGEPLVNSALWVIPEWSDAYGLQIKTRRQGQWLIGYPWSSADGAQPVWLTATVCYDATDLGLAADLRNVSDVLAIPALNKDVKTFDGSNAYWPRSDAHIRQVFHTHGELQAAIAFLEIDDIGAFLERHDVSGANADDWKHPPAGINRGQANR